MKNKGFTLIELLAVIVILAIIALIATPTILGVVEDARRGAAEQSVLGFIDAVEKQAMINEMDSDATNDFSDSTLTISELTNSTYKVTVKGQKPDGVGAYEGDPTENGTVTVDDGEVQSAAFSLGKYKIDYDKSTGKATARK